MIKLYNNDCLTVLKTMKDNSVDSLITDCPAGISFMSKGWDDDKGGRDQWIAWMKEIMVEVYRVLKPGAHGLVWALPRTSHWTATALEDSGFEIRDVISHIFGSGFPKSLNVGKAIEATINTGKSSPKGMREDRMKDKYEPTGQEDYKLGRAFGKVENDQTETVLDNEDAKKYEGWGTAMKPSHENYILIRKPCSEKTVAKNMIKYGTGGINIDESRIPYTNAYDEIGGKGESISNLKTKQYRVIDGKLEQYHSGKGVVIDAEHKYREIEIEEVNPNHRNSSSNYELGFQGGKGDGKKIVKKIQVYKTVDKEEINGTNTFSQGKWEWVDWKVEGIIGRFPSNTIFSHLDECVDGYCEENCAVKELDRQSGITKTNTAAGKKYCNKQNLDTQVQGWGFKRMERRSDILDSGGASRYFYVPKISTKERNMGMGNAKKETPKGRDEKQDQKNVPHKQRIAPQQNNHPTVKTIKLMSYLINMITPKDGIVLDPFMGSGSTLMAAKQLGFGGIGIEKEKEYFEIAKKRIKFIKKGNKNDD